VATEAAWLNGEKERRTHVKSKTLLTGTGLLMEGTLTTTAPNGKNSVTWAYSGQNTTPADFYGFGPFDGTLTITGGTGKFEGAHGSASFTAASGPTFTAGPSPIQYAGTAFYAVHGTIAQRDHD
jgi:hypothetical protein